MELRRKAFFTILVFVAVLNFKFYSRPVIVAAKFVDTRVMPRPISRATTGIIDLRDILTRPRDRKTKSGPIGGPNKHEGDALDCSKDQYERGYKCPEPGWEWVYQTCIYFSKASEKMSWDDARSACEAMESDLVILPNQAFFERLLSLSVIPQTLDHWIGLSSKNSPGIFKWINGSILAQWGSDQIDGCVKTNKEGWVSGDCTQTRGFICQRRPDFSPYLSGLQITFLSGNPIGFEELQEVKCKGHFYLDRGVCLFWRPANHSSPDFIEAACEQERTKVEGVLSQTYKHRYHRDYDKGPCIRGTALYVRFFADYREMFHGMKLKCCRPKYNDSWLGYQEPKCSVEKTLQVIDKIYTPSITISLKGGKELQVLEGMTSVWICSTDTKKDGLLSMGWLSEDNMVTWVVVHTMNTATQSFGAQPEGLSLVDVIGDTDVRVLAVQYEVKLGWSYHGGRFVCWASNSSAMVGQAFNTADKPANVSKMLTVHYRPGKPDLTVLQQKGSIIIANCSSAVSNFDYSRLMWGLYLSETYIDVISIDRNGMVGTQGFSSDFNIQEVQVAVDPVAGPTISSTVEISLPKFFRKGTIFCLSFYHDREHLFKPAMPGFDFHTYLNISRHVPGNDGGQASTLLALRLVVLLVLLAIAGTGAGLFMTKPDDSNEVLISMG